MTTTDVTSFSKEQVKPFIPNAQHAHDALGVENTATNGAANQPETMQKGHHQHSTYKFCRLFWIIIPILFITFLVSYKAININVNTVGAKSTPIQHQQQNEETKDNDAPLYTPIFHLTGVVINDHGIGIGGAKVTLETSYEKETIEASESGRFKFSVESISHAKVVVSADGHRPEILHTVIAALRGGEDGDKLVTTVKMDPIILPRYNPNAVRMLFGGDVSFGRKWLDPDLSTPSAESAIPKDNPEALILASDPEPGTTKALQCLKPWFLEADFRSVNLETPVLNDPRTPNTHKLTTFFTLPGSLRALKNTLGVDYVSLANNHIYDYLEDGLETTLKNIDTLNISRSGAGIDAAAAMAPYRTTTLSPQQTAKYSFLSLTNVNNFAAKDNDQYNVFATKNKGGAADIRNPSNALSHAITKDAENGYISIPQLHVGVEYSTKPNEAARRYMQTVTDLGAPLNVMHHPHLAHGIGVLKSSEPEESVETKVDIKSRYEKRTIHLMSLGLLVMDTEYLESLLSIVARVDMSPDGTRVERVRLLPIYLENYAPKPVGGLLASRFIRHLSELSHEFHGHLYPYNGMGYLSLGKGNDDTIRKERFVIVDITIPSSGSVVIDLRKWLGMDESFSSWSFYPHKAVTNNFRLSVQSGRDIYGFGDFEDSIVDTFEERSAEIAIKARWDLGEHGQPCTDHIAYRGSRSLCSFIPLTSSKQSKKNMTALSFEEQNKTTFASEQDNMATLYSSKQDTIASDEMSNKGKIHFPGFLTSKLNKDLTLMGYVMGKNAGYITVEAKYYASAVTSKKKFGKDVAFEHDGGTFDWTVFAMDLNVPPDIIKKSARGANPSFDYARALRISMHHSLSSESKNVTNWENDALAAFDEIAVISWEDKKIGPDDVLKVPHARDFLKVKGTPGSYQLKLAFVRRIPTAASLHSLDRLR